MILNEQRLNNSIFFVNNGFATQFDPYPSGRFSPVEPIEDRVVIVNIDVPGFYNVSRERSLKSNLPKQIT